MAVKGNAKERNFVVRSQNQRGKSKLRPIGFGLGNFFRFIRQGQMGPTIKKMQTLKVSSVELPTYPKVGSRRLSPKQQQQLRSMNYVSIHAPPSFGARITRGKKAAIRSATLLNKRCHQIGAKNIIIHPTEMPRPEVIPILQRGGVKILIENSEKVRGQTKNNYEAILRKYPEFGMCLDVSHAIMWSPDETRKIVKKWGNRIAEVHFSNFSNGKTHASFEKGNRIFVESIQAIKPLLQNEVKLIIEENLSTTETKWLWKEINRIQRMVS
jgi:hypothetical protein